MISTRSVELVIDTVVCLTLAKWETVSGQFGGYLIEHVGAERKCKAVDIRFAFAGRQDRYDRNCSFENYRGNEHRDRTLADDVGTFHKIGSMSATPEPRVCNLGEASPTCSLGSAEDRLYPLRTA